MKTSQVRLREAQAVIEDVIPHDSEVEVNNVKTVQEAPQPEVSSYKVFKQNADAAKDHIARI